MNTWASNILLFALTALVWSIYFARKNEAEAHAENGRRAKMERVGA